MSNKTLIEWNADVGTRFLTIHPDGSFDIDKDAPPLFVIGELTKAFIRQQERIKRLEEAGDGLMKSINCGCPYGPSVFNCQTCTNSWDAWREAKEAKL